MRRAKLQDIIQICDREQCATAAIHWHVMDIINLSGGIVLESDEFEQAHLRYDEPLAATGNQEPRNNGESQRDFQFDRCTLTGNTHDVNSAADLFDVRFDNIHTHTTAGNIGHLASS